MSAELIARLEAATKGSRELDLAVAKALGFRPIQTIRGVQVHNPAQPAEVSWDLKPYTTSLDAALTIVPEGWGWRAEHGLGHGCSFTVGHVGANNLYDRPEGWGKASTPALALCIAALWAREGVKQ